MTADRPRLCFAGPMLGRNPGWVPSQAEVLGEHFRREGYEVRLTSPHVRRLPRLVDTVVTLVRWRRHIDVLHVMVFGGRLSFAMADATVMLARILGFPIALHLRGGALPELWRRHPRWVRRVLGGGNALVSPSRYLSSQLARADQSITVIPNIIPIGDYPFQLREGVRPSMLWMRTFHPLYNPELALEVLVRLRQRHPAATLTMAGQEKGELARVRSRAHELGLDGAVRFLGFLDPAAKQREFARHDVFLNTNRVDNMPVSVLEALAFGLPVVATEVGGIPYLLEDGRTALLVPDDDPRSMVCGVQRLLANPALARTLSRNGRALAEASAWPTVFPQWQALIDEVVQRRPRRPSALREGGRASGAGAEPRDQRPPALDRPATSSGDGRGDGGEPVRMEPVIEDGLTELALLHRAAFPRSVMTRLGVEAVRRYYEWQLTGPHDAVLLGARTGATLVGFVVGGTFQGALSGYLGANRAFLLRSLLTRPWLFADPLVHDRLRVGWGRAPVGRRSPVSPRSVPARRPESESFGVLAIGVHPASRQTGVGGLLLEAMVTEARNRGFPQLHAVVHPENLASISLFRAYGFLPHAPHGRWEGRMRLVLGATA